MLRSKKGGFTLIELLIVIVIIGILAAVAISRFTGAQDRARVSAAEHDLNQCRQALGLYEIDYADYPATMTMANAVYTLVDPQKNPYMSLPTGVNFSEFTYEYNGKQTPTSYVIRATCRDKQKTVMYATPEGVELVKADSDGRYKATGKH